MRWVGLIALLATACKPDPHEQAYQVMLAQFAEVEQQAKEGKRILPAYLAEADALCFRARHERDKVKAARPLADACDRSLELIRAHSQ